MTFYYSENDKFKEFDFPNRGSWSILHSLYCLRIST